jgi:hypothetical protein
MGARTACAHRVRAAARAAATTGRRAPSRQGGALRTERSVGGCEQHEGCRSGGSLYRQGVTGCARRALNVTTQRSPAAAEPAARSRRSQRSRRGSPGPQSHPEQQIQPPSNRRCRGRTGRSQSHPASRLPRPVARRHRRLSMRAGLSVPIRPGLSPRIRRRGSWPGSRSCPHTTARSPPRVPRRPRPMHRWLPRPCCRGSRPRSLAGSARARQRRMHPKRSIASFRGKTRLAAATRSRSRMRCW